MKCTDETFGQEDEPAAGPPVARFEIWPHRSLDARGTRLVLAIATLVVVAAFARNPNPHALPLIIGPLLAVGALAFAFRCNNRAAARSGETVEIWPDVVRVIRRTAKGRQSPVEFATGWVRVALAQDRDVANRIVLRQSGRTYSVGECLSPDERATLAKALQEALAKARRTTNAA